MKLIQFSDGWVLDEIKEDRNPSISNIMKKNLQGRLSPGSMFKPEHVILVWIDDMDIKETLEKELHLFLKPYESEVKDENGDIVGTRTRYMLKFKAYPKVYVDEDTGKEHTSPTVMLKVKKNERLPISRFKDIDNYTLSNLAITFHEYPNQFDVTKPSVASIDAIWAIADPSIRKVTDSYLRNKYGGDDVVEDDQEEVPFN